MGQSTIAKELGERRSTVGAINRNNSSNKERQDNSSHMTKTLLRATPSTSYHLHPVFLMRTKTGIAPPRGNREFRD